jgi:hypothetical protein
MPPTPTPTPPPPPPPTPTPPPPPTPTPPPPTPPPTPPPPPNYYPYNGTDCSGNNITIYTLSANFSLSNAAYTDSGLTTYSGYFIYSGIAYYYSSGTGSQYSYAHVGTDCNGSPVTIYTTSATWSIASTAYSDQCLTTGYNGYFIYNGVVYLYTSGSGTTINSYGHSLTDCIYGSITIYTNSSTFNIGSTAYANQCSTTLFNGSIIYAGNTYKYSSGIASQSYAYVGINCSGSSVTIYTFYSSFAYIDSAYSDACGAALYHGYFIIGGETYFYTDGSASSSSCPTPPPPPTPTPPPSPMPSYTNPNILKADLHASYETGLGTWQNYRVNVTGLFAANSGTNRSDYRDHLIREFNRKISILNQPTGLFIRPFDNGFRFTGVSIQ